MWLAGDGCGCKEILYIDFLILLIATPLVSALVSATTFCSYFFLM